FNNLLPYTFLVNSIPYYIRLLCSDKTVWLYCCFNCAMTLYIPLRSDKTHEEMFGCQYVPFFISHYVQIKLESLRLISSFVTLYIPLRSDKTKYEKVLLIKLEQLYIPLRSDKTIARYRK